MKTVLHIIVTTFVVILMSCGNNKQEDLTVLTERIQYPVFINNPYPDEGDWWKENMEGPKREKFVKYIFDAAYSGKIKAYNYDDQPLTVDQVKAIGNETDTIRSTRPYPPYDEFDTIVSNVLDLRDIHRITFLEEWYINEKNMQITKKVVGVCPALTIFEDSNAVKGYKPLFWLYFDDKYPVK